MMLPQPFSSPGNKFLIAVDFWRLINFNSFPTNHTEIYRNKKVFVVFGGDFGAQRQEKSVSK